MKPLYLHLQEARKNLGISWEILERDYLLSWVLAGISVVEPLGKTLVFKGGTALKKCYFGNYRFSEDLDFSALENSPAGPSLEQAIHQVCIASKSLLEEYTSIDIVWERYTERDIHLEGQEAFVIRAQFPWQNTPHTRVKIEITKNETLVRPIDKLK